MQTDLVQFESIILKFTGKVKEMAKTILKKVPEGKKLVYTIPSMVGVIIKSHTHNIC